MKNIFKTLLFVFGLLLVQSCDDELVQNPNDSLSPSDYYTNSSEFEFATRGIYSAFLGGSYYGGSLLSLPDIMTDNVILAQRGRRSNQSFHEWRHSPNLAWGMLYSPYIVTNRANLILNNIDNLEDGADKNNFIGEARAARALALFDMVRVYSKIPTQNGAEESLGLPIITGIDPNVRELRPNVADSYQFIKDELEAAKSLINTDNGVGRLNKEVVSALLSRVYLYMGEYQNAVNSANEVTTSISSFSEVTQVWKDASEAGVLFKIDQDRNLDGVSIGVEWSQSTANNEVVPEYVVSFELNNLYQSTDARRNAYIANLPDQDGEIYNAIFKMYGETGQQNGVIDPKIIRAAEVALNKAEAHYFLGQEPQALAALDELRANRYSDYAAGTETGSDLIAAIQLERRLELFAEGHRLFDLKRWNLGVSRSATDGEFIDGTGTPVPSAFQNLSAGSHLFQMPIPIAEINVFPDFQQNPGYN
ncbi:MAG: RagB/SusD family nutrient uptake outer membrane protein [Bacteroidetes bacterium]|nr:RagB/SusD family nutrient uptake outer membrane protein [Bacteroidota bacterium]